jgi:hypothetical protein
MENEMHDWIGEAPDAAERFFNKWMPVYAMVVCIACFCLLAALGIGVLAGLVSRALG